MTVLSLFRVCLGLLLAIGVLYPLATLLAGWIFRVRPRRYACDDELPPVQLVISAHDEEAVIARRIGNALALDYPAGRLEVVVVDDASSDRTRSITAGFADPRVRLVAAPRGGKNAALNHARPVLRAPVLVFSDANSVYERDALRRLVEPFADPRVGMVVGELRYAHGDETAAARGEGTYWRLEQWIKRCEGRMGRALVGNGSILAMRQEHLTPLRPDVANDFQWPVEIRAAGLLCLYEPGAVAVERAASTLGEEYRRKVRIVSRGMRGFLTLLPRLGALQLVQLLFRKVLRWLTGLFVLGAFATSLPLLGEPLPTTVFVGLAAGLLFALAGALRPSRPGGGHRSLFDLPLYACVVQAAGLVGCWRGLRGRSPAMWDVAKTTRAPAVR